MIRNLLIVCTGNICRSPVGEFAVRAHVPGVGVASAGLGALVGEDMDAASRRAAEDIGLDPGPHEARQFDDSLGRGADLILVMERRHRTWMSGQWPHFLGKTFLLGNFSDNLEIPDPYRKDYAAHRMAAEMIVTCVKEWAKQVAPTPRPTRSGTV